MVAVGGRKVEECTRESGVDSSIDFWAALFIGGNQQHNFDQFDSEVPLWKRSLKK